MVTGMDFVCLNCLSNLFVVFVFKKFHQFQRRDRKQICLLAFESSRVGAAWQPFGKSEMWLPEDLPRVKGEGITKLANIVNCNFVEASEGLGHHWNKSKTLPVAIICHPPVFPIVGKSQGEARLFSFSSNSCVLKRVYYSDIESSIEPGMPMGNEDICWPPVNPREQESSLFFGV